SDVPKTNTKPDRRAKADADAAQAREREQRAEARRQQEAEKARRRVERHKLESALSAAKADLAARERVVAHLETDLAKARTGVKDGRAAVDEIAAELTALEDSE
ncbi:MAG: hypothetical protein AB7L28_29415, partial [Kofleriaceae bacterium]